MGFYNICMYGIRIPFHSNCTCTLCNIAFLRNICVHRPKKYEMIPNITTLSLHSQLWLLCILLCMLQRDRENSLILTAIIISHHYSSTKRHTSSYTLSLFACTTVTSLTYIIYSSRQGSKYFFVCVAIFAKDTAADSHYSLT